VALSAFSLTTVSVDEFANGLVVGTFIDTILFTNLQADNEFLSCYAM
jgi:hypothetical protein